MLITNDPWMTAGQINDLTVATPVFRGDRMIGLFASTCHAPDIGGRLLSAEAQRGVRGGPAAADHEARPRAASMNEDLLDADPRQRPHAARDDRRPLRPGRGQRRRRPQPAALPRRPRPRGPRGRRRGDPPPLRDAPCATRSRKLPDGRYEAVGYSDGHGERIELRLAAIIDGDEITLDFAGSSPQSEHGINVVLNYTHAYASFALKAAVAPGVPHNDGSFTPVHVTAPEGSILNCREPAPVASRHVVGHFVPGLVLAALAPVLERRSRRQRRRALDQRLEPVQPDALPVRRRGRVGRPRRPQRQRLPVGGRLRPDRGARALRAARPARALAAHRLRRRGPVARRARPDVGDDPARAAASGACPRSPTARRSPPRAPTAATTARPGAVSVDGEPLPTKRLTRLGPGARVRLDLPGGGGVGDPRERDPQAVLRDVVDGYVSLEAAQSSTASPSGRLREGRVLLPEDFEIQEEA